MSAPMPIPLFAFISVHSRFLFLPGFNQRFAYRTADLFGRGALLTANERKWTRMPDGIKQRRIENNGSSPHAFIRVH